MSEKLTNLEFQIAFGAVRHFGRNLYTTNPPAIAELVANAWDAYARNCTLYYTSKSLLLVDNGIGMNDEEFQLRYATSGKQKNTNVRKPDSMQIRPYMGKKGIGKFSAFSLADSYILLTKSDEDSAWKKIQLDKNILEIDDAKVNIPVENIESLELLEKEFNCNLSDLTTGTILWFKDLKRVVTKSTIESLEKLLSQRFSISTILKDGDFSVNLVHENEITKVDFSKHFFYDKVENVHYFGYEKKDIKELFKNTPDKFIVKEDSFSEEISGWVASVDIPADLKVSEETVVKGISIYINGKLVDEDILRTGKKDRIADAYIIGEVNADYLGLLDEDVVLSSREGLFLDSPEVIELKIYLEEVKKNLVSQWDEMRASRDVSKQEYIAKVITKPENKSYYEKLNPDSQKKFLKYAQKLFDKPGVEVERQEKIADLLFSALIQIVNNEEFQQLLSKEDVEDSEILAYISAILNINEINHALRLRDSVKSKLAVIAKLKQCIQKQEVESAFEIILADNPWLINPHWENHKTIYTQKWLTYVRENNADPERLRTDIILEVTDERLPVVVELKREKPTAYSAPDVIDVSTQIFKYRRAICQKIQEVEGKIINPDDIKAYFICGTKALSELHANQSDISYLETNRIIVMSYENMIDTAERILQVMYNVDVE